MDYTFPQKLREIYEQSRDKTALVLQDPRSPDLVLTYHDLLCGAAGYAQVLQSSGILPGEVVIIILNHGRPLIEAFWGAILNGAIPSIMPFLTEKLAPDQYRNSLAALFQVTDPAAVITSSEYAQDVRQALSSTQPACRLLLAEQVSALNELDFSSMQGFARLPEDIVLLQHSSGTTGLQKGVALSHAAIFNQLESYSRALKLQDSDLIVSWLPLYHDMGLIASFILPILSQVPLVLQSPFDWVRAPVRLFEAVTRYHGTLTWLPNFAYNFCAKKIRDRELEGIDLSSWRAVINCSEPIHWKSHQMFLERFAPYGLRPEALATCYAMAENVFAVSQGGIDSPVVVDSIDSRQLLSQGLATPSQGEEAGMLLVSSGRLLDCTQVRIVDSRHQNLPERCLGEIALSSNCMLTGYYHRDDLTAKVFDQGWYLTGDMGYLANGELFVTGRKKDILIVGGKNIYPGDLERLAGDVPGIHPGRVVAFGVFNEESGTEDVVLVAEAEQEEMASGSEAARLANDIRQRINQGSDVVARAVKIVGRGWLIKTSSGKIARNANRDKYLGGSYPR